MFAPRTSSLCTAPTRPSRTQTVLHHSPGLGSFLTAWAEASEPWVTWEQIPNGKTKRKQISRKQISLNGRASLWTAGKPGGFQSFSGTFLYCHRYRRRHRYKCSRTCSSLHAWIQSICSSHVDPKWLSCFLLLEKASAQCWKGANSPTNPGAHSPRVQGSDIGSFQRPTLPSAVRLNSFSTMGHPPFA